MLDGRVLVITGAGGGIGARTVAEATRAGAAVVLVGRDEDRLRRASPAAGRVLVCPADVTSVADMERVFARAVDAFGAVHAVFNAAGVAGTVGSLRRETEANFDYVFAVNVKGTWATIRAALPVLAPGASVVNCSSGVGLVGSAGMASYSAAKHAVIGLTKSLAIELAPRGIRVNVISPGPTETSMLQALRAARGGGVAPRDPADTAVPQVADPSEIARMVVFLTAGTTDAMTGAVISLDGGHAAGR